MSDKPIRVQLSRAKGWRMPPNTVKVVRPGRWGNPYVVRANGGFYPSEAVKLFEHSMRGGWSPSWVDGYADAVADRIYAAHCAFQKRHHHDPRYWARVDLRGKNLACWCRLDACCHADVLLKIANS